MRRGATPTSDASNWNGPHVWLTPEDLAPRDGQRIASSRRTLTDQGLASSSATLAPPGSLVLSSRAPIGYVAETETRAATNQGCMTLIPRDELDARYFRYQLFASRPALEALGQGATFVELASQSLRSFDLVAPPVEAQRAIADFLDRETDRIDSIIVSRRRELELVEERLRVDIFRAATGANSDGEHVQSRLGWVDQLPRRWPIVPLRYVARLGSGHTPSRSVPEYWKDCTIPWISLFDVGKMRNPFQERISETTQLINELGLANSSAQLHSAGTVVLSRTASVGFAIIMGSPMAVSQHFVTWTCSEAILPEFLLYLLRAMRQTWEALQVGTTNVTVFMPDLMAVRIPLPSAGEQRTIVETIRGSVASASHLVNSISQQVDLLSERRRSLITAAVEGTFVK